jgi:hypothetical protein
MLNLFKPRPLTFGERREIVLRNWLRYGYGRRTRVIERKPETLGEKINCLMYMQTIS